MLNRPTLSRRPRRFATGSALLEPIVALALFSVGLLGLVGAQTTYMKHNSKADNRGQAVLMIDELVGQMIVDRANLAAYAHRAGGSTCASSGDESTHGPLLAWRQRVQQFLPGATAARQQVVIGANGLTTITLCWLEVGDTDARRLVVVTQIN